MIFQPLDDQLSGMLREEFLDYEKELGGAWDNTYTAGLERWLRG